MVLYRGNTQPLSRLFHPRWFSEGPAGSLVLLEVRQVLVLSVANGPRSMRCETTPRNWGSLRHSRSRVGDYDGGLGLRGEVAGPALVLCARRLAWSRELALTSLAARLRVSPFGRLLSFLALPRPWPPFVPLAMETVMTPRKQKIVRVAPSPDSLRVANPHAAGIDVHAAVHWVAVPADHVPPAKTKNTGSTANVPPQVRRFGACTTDLELLADWLRQCGATSVAMESTGVYWIPLFELLERRGFQVYLVDPRQTKHAPGRPKSDVLDCQWIQRLHSYGLLTAS